MRRGSDDAVSQSLAGIRILVVDDDDDSREVLAQTLSLDGATVTTVSTAREALAFVPKTDIILADIILPVEDGVWLLEQVNQQSRRVPVIGISGYDERQDPRLAAAPFVRKFLKPLDFNQICADIVAVLRSPS